MANLSINLLPQELTAEKKQHQKANAVVRLCVIVLVLIIVAAGIVLSFRFAQNAQLGKTQSQINDTKQQINTPENSQREGLVVTLDSRLDSLNQINSLSYPAQYSFTMLSKMLPTNVAVVSFAVDKKGKSQVQIKTPDTASLTQFLNNLMDPGQNNQKITSASVVGISTDNKTGQYNVSLELVFAGGAK